MNISSQELYADGFWRAGTVYPDAATTLRVEINRDAHGFVVYLMVVNHEVVKAGRTTTPLSTRMRSTFKSLTNARVMERRGEGADHPPKTTREHAQATLRAGHQVELWAKQFPSFELMMARESELNNKYQGIWTTEGRHRASGRGAG